MRPEPFGRLRVKSISRRSWCGPESGRTAAYPGPAPDRQVYDDTMSGTLLTASPRRRFLNRGDEGSDRGPSASGEPQMVR